MNIERLQILAQALRRFDKQSFGISKFDMLVFASKAPEHKTALAADVCGFACLIPDLNEQGLELKWKGMNAVPIYKGHTQEDAISFFFELDLGTMEEVFWWYFYGVDASEITPAMVADKIFEVIGREKFGKTG